MRACRRCTSDAARATRSLARAGEYDASVLPSHFNHVQIVVRALDRGYYRVTVQKKPEVPEFGPVFGTAILDSGALGSLVRECAVQGDIACRVMHKGKVRVCAPRGARGVCVCRRGRRLCAFLACVRLCPHTTRL
jgi:hypothetical protein